MPPCPTPAYHVKATQPLAFDRFTLKLSVEDDFEFPDFLRHIKAKILGHKTEEKPTVMGYVTAQLVRIAKAQQLREDLWDVMDNHSEALASVYKGLWDKNGNETDMLLSLDCSPLNLLFINSVLLEAPYRGHGIGLLAVHAVIESLASFDAPQNRKWVVSLPFIKSEVEIDTGNDVVLLCPAGMTGVESTGPDLDHAAIERKLIDYWGNLGFHVLGRNAGIHDVLMSLETIDGQLNIEEVVPHLITKDEKKRIWDQRQAMLDSLSTDEKIGEGEESGDSSSE
ncbi:unnamed protein product [Zymoseptoria tritici ST99CH_3D7]|uniref:Uncharacterized protein n=1 Tax=Zymoseptoria tritici (strain ST99CH_3D7) TaxID=1276538 RepID=A0A1X7S1Y3_ZYMT9|nr:unnamed protein product [Zymoseptoria tritici ST99CH_3D7]